MRNYDLSTFSRSSIGFEPFLNILNGASRRLESEGNFPPYDIIKKDDANYTICLALAGFTPDELSITTHQNLLTIAGRKPTKEKRDYLHEGITHWQFERQFGLADQVEVTNAAYENGILEIDLHKEVPEAAKPRRIAINGGERVRKLLS